MLNLKQFSGGTDDRYQDTLGTKLANVIYTGGVKYVAEQAQAYWLIDDICIYQTKPKVRREPFQSWVLKVNKAKNTATLTCEDGNGNEVFTTNIGFTDFPDPEIKLWLIDDSSQKVLLLPEEY